MAKTFYHGTVDKFVPSIKKHGLVPAASAGNIWHIKTISGREVEDEPSKVIYLTPVERRAIEYAETRVRYYAAKGGEKFYMFDTRDVPFIKDEGQPSFETKPVLLVIELPDDFEVVDDPDDPGSYVYNGGSIPAKFIKEIRELGPEIVDKRKRDVEILEEQGAPEDFIQHAKMLESIDMLAKLLGMSDSEDEDNDREDSDDPYDRFVNSQRPDRDFSALDEDEERLTSHV